MKRKRWLLPAVLIVGALAAAMAVRLRFEDQQMDEYIKTASILPGVYADQFDPDLSMTAYEIFDNSLDTYDELERHAGDVVVGEVVDQCQDHGTIKTSIQIHQVIKGDLKEAQTVEVDEPVYFTEDQRDFPDGRLEGSQGYLPMKKGRQYMLFLQRHPYGDAYGLISDLYGKLPVDAPLNVYHAEYTGEYIPLSQLDAYDVFYIDPSEDKQYLAEEMKHCDADGSDNECVRLKKKEDALALYERYEQKLTELWQACQEKIR